MNITNQSDKPIVRLIGKYFIEVPIDHPSIRNFSSHDCFPKALDMINTTILIENSGRAIFIWINPDHKNSNLIKCACFINASKVKSWQLVKDASYVASLRWPKGTVAVTDSIANASKMKYQFKKAGWLRNLSRSSEINGFQYSNPY